MASINLILPKVHIFFYSEDNKETVEELLTVSFSQILEGYINTYLVAIGQSGLTATLVSNSGKVYENNNNWIVGIKVVVEGDTELSVQSFDSFWIPIKDYIKNRIEVRFEEFGLNFTNLRFHFESPGSEYGEEET
jgi:hypothetical protein